MARNKKSGYKDVGLEIALIFARYFLRTDYLHYGYWTEGLAVEPDNLLCAQQNYCDLLISRIPPGTRRILDVGCGTGKFAHELQQRGYCVDCVSPNAMLTTHARRRLGADQVIFECLFENLQTDQRYDLILFSESFQYIPLEQAFQKSQDILTDDGHLLICDFFRADIAEPSPLGGGHKLPALYEGLKQHHFDLLEDKDITTQTAPNLDLVRDLLNQVAFPVSSSLQNALQQKHPTLFKILAWVFQKRIGRIRRRYAQNSRNGANFARFKSYRLLLCQKLSCAVVVAPAKPFALPEPVKI